MTDITMDIDTQALRQRILTLAIQGKLTDQRKEDGTAQDLYNQIQEEKQKLIKEKKIKKTKSLPKIEEDEIPFDIPENWMWVRLGDVSYNKDGQRIPLKQADRDKQKNIYDYYGASGVIDQVEDYLFDKPLLLISEDGANLLARTKPIAFIARGKYWVNNHAHVLDGIDIYFLEYLRLYVDATNLSSFITGTAQPKLTQAKLNRLVIALPPLAEQKRIADKVVTLFTQLDAIDKAYEEYRGLQQTMKSRLLEQAIQGKLTDQRKEDGNAQDLYKEIQEEKQKLIKEKKIKKEKPLPEIAADEIPFEIPENWMWVRISDLFDVARGGSPRPIKSFLTDDPNGVNWIKIGDTEIGGKYISHVREKIKPEGVKKSRFVRSGDLLLTNSMSYGRPYILKTDGCIHDGWLMLSPILRSLNKEFFYYLSSSQYMKQEFTKAASGAVVKNLNKDKVKAISIPLPPLAEQKRIVEKLDKLLPLCEA